MKKAIIIALLVIIVAGISGGTAYFIMNKETDIEKEVIEIVNNLNSGSGEYGDWSKSLKIVKVNEVKKIDNNLLSDEDKSDIDETTSVFMMNIEEETYGNVQIVVVNGNVTANSLLGETYPEMWNSNIFIKDSINVEKINKKIK